MFSFYENSRSTKYGRTSTNMYLQFKWDVENYANHRFNVATAKPSIDNSAPLTFTHMFIRPKKLQLELERYSQIQRNNRFLMERLATIHREGAWIDNKNYQEIKSLNTWKRQQEMINLAYNNQIMIARLHDVKARHNRNKLEDEYLINQKYKATIRKYPPNWREIKDRMDRLRDDTFKKVFDYKYQKKEYQKSRKKVLDRWRAETEKHEAAKAKRIAREAAEAERQEQLLKEKKKAAAKEQKKTMEELNKTSVEWKAAREERLKLLQEYKKKQQEKEAEKEKAKQEVDNKRRQRIKEQIEAEKKIREEKRIEEEEKRKREQEMKRQATAKKLKARLAERKQPKKHAAPSSTSKQDSVKNIKAEKDRQIKTRKTVPKGFKSKPKETDTQKEENTMINVESGKVSDDQTSETGEILNTEEEFSDTSEEKTVESGKVSDDQTSETGEVLNTEEEFSDTSEEKTDDEREIKSPTRLNNENQSASETSEQEQRNSSPTDTDDSKDEDNEN